MACATAAGPNPHFRRQHQRCTGPNQSVGAKTLRLASVCAHPSQVVGSASLLATATASIGH
eukprot:7802402-Lingulodinium_polyedra.AAC.1